MILVGHSWYDENDDLVIDSTGWYFIDPQTNDLTEYQNIREQPSLSNVSWSPDGRWLALDSGGIIQILSRDKTIHQVLFDSLRSHHPTWSPDGKWIAFDVRFSATNGARGLWKVKADGSTAKQFVRPPIEQGCINCNGLDRWVATYPDWSPTGDEIAFVAYENLVGYNHLAIYDTLTANVSIILSSSQEVRYPKFSPDGSRILFTSQSSNGGEFVVWVVNRDGSDPTPLALGAWEPSWSPDGSQIAFVKFSYSRLQQPGNGSLWVMDASGKSKRQITFVE